MTEPSKKERRRQLFEHDLLPEHLQAIGTVAVRSALLDLMIEQTAENITKSYPKTVRKRLQSLSVPRQLDMIGEMLTAQLRGDKFGIEDFIRDVHQAREDNAQPLAQRRNGRSETPARPACMEAKETRKERHTGEHAGTVQ